MALQEPVLRAIALSFGWKHAHVFPDVRGALTEALVAATDAGDQWFWDTMDGSPVVLAGNDGRRLHSLVGPESFDIVSEYPDTDALAAAAVAIADRCFDLLHVSELESVGASASWTLAAREATDAEGALESWLFSPRLRTTLGPLGGRPDDLIVSARFEAAHGVVTTLRTEPVTDEQAVNGPFFISDMEASEFSPASLLVHVDRRQRATLQRHDGPDRASRVLRQLLSQTDKLLATVGTSDDAADDQNR